MSGRRVYHFPPDDLRPGEVFTHCTPARQQEIREARRRQREHAALEAVRINEGSARTDERASLRRQLSETRAAVHRAQSAVRRLNRGRAERRVEAAIADGRLDRSERERVLRRLEADFDWAAQDLAGLRPDPMRAYRNELAANPGLDEQHRALIAQLTGLKPEQVI